VDGEALVSCQVGDRDHLDREPVNARGDEAADAGQLACAPVVWEDCADSRSRRGDHGLDLAEVSVFAGRERWVSPAVFGDLLLLDAEDVGSVIGGWRDRDLIFDVPVDAGPRLIPVWGALIRFWASWTAPDP